MILNILSYVLDHIIAIIALCLTIFSLYMQFFHRPRRLRAITLPPYLKDNKTRFGICNASKETVYITGLYVEYSIPWYHGSTKGYPVSDVQGASVINPGSIVEFSYKAKSPPKEFMKDVPEIINSDGVPEKKVNIKVSIQFAFPDGKIYSNWFTSGSYMVSENSISESVRGVNLNLLKGPLPILDKKLEDIDSSLVEIN